MKPNIYDCQQCGGETVTRHADGAEDGVTPMMIRCRANADCSGVAYSRFYKVSPEELQRAEWEWFKPTGRAYRKLSSEMREHVDLGGLSLRPVSQGGTP